MHYVIYYVICCCSFVVICWWHCTLFCCYHCCYICCCCWCIAPFAAARFARADSSLYFRLLHVARMHTVSYVLLTFYYYPFAGLPTHDCEFPFERLPPLLVCTRSVCVGYVCHCRCPARCHGCRFRSFPDSHLYIHAFSWITFCCLLRLHRLHCSVRLRSRHRLHFTLFTNFAVARDLPILLPFCCVSYAFVYVAVSRIACLLRYFMGEFVCCLWLRYLLLLYVYVVIYVVVPCITLLIPCCCCCCTLMLHCCDTLLLCYLFVVTFDTFYVIVLFILHYCCSVDVLLYVVLLNRTFCLPSVVVVVYYTLRYSVHCCCYIVVVVIVLLLLTHYSCYSVVLLLQHYVTICAFVAPLPPGVRPLRCYVALPAICSMLLFRCGALPLRCSAFTFTVVRLPAFWCVVLTFVDLLMLLLLLYIVTFVVVVVVCCSTVTLLRLFVCCSIFIIHYSLFLMILLCCYLLLLLLYIVMMMCCCVVGYRVRLLPRSFVRCVVAYVRCSVRCVELVRCVTHPFRVAFVLPHTRALLPHCRARWCRFTLRVLGALLDFVAWCVGWILLRYMNYAFAVFATRYDYIVGVHLHCCCCYIYSTWCCVEYLFWLMLLCSFIVVVYVALLRCWKFVTTRLIYLRYRYWWTYVVYDCLLGTCSFTRYPIYLPLHFVLLYLMIVVVVHLLFI